MTVILKQKTADQALIARAATALIRSDGIICNQLQSGVVEIDGKRYVALLDDGGEFLASFYIRPRTGYLKRVR